ncbi:MAG: hypothetical protein OEW19_11010, partial [Acidobacteriota bacterium]|nr:hypothetical protein [Acidobacteriota bacterium]
QPVVLTPGEVGSAYYQGNLANRNPTLIGPGTVLEVETAASAGSTAAALADLIAQDPGASWNATLNGGLGGVQGGCMGAGTCAVSPRIVSLPVYDPDVFNAGTPFGRTDITVVKVIGFFLESMQGDDAVGRIMTYPSAPRSGASSTPEAAFVVSIVLVR